MMEAVKNGAGREDAYEAIKEHAISAVKDLRSGKIKENDLPVRLAGDKRIGLGIRSIVRFSNKVKWSWCGGSTS